METLEFRKKREIGEIINGTFAFLRQNWKPLGKSVFIYAAPFAFLGGAFGGLGQSSIPLLGKGDENAIVEELPYILGNFSLLGVFLLASSVMMSGVVYQYIKLYIEKNGRQSSTQEIWEAMRPNLAGYFGYMFVAYLCIIIGFIFCIIPGIYLAIPLTMILAVKTFDNLSLSQSFNRCFYLVNNYWWKTFLVLFVVNLIVGIAGGIASLPTSIISTTINLTSLQQGEDAGYIAKILLVSSSVLSYGISSLLGVVTITATSLQYFNLAEIKEGVGSMQKLEQLGRANEPANEDDFKETY